MTDKTIIEIQIWPDPDPGKFMWRDTMTYETGIGSGQVYYEDSLFDTKEEAEQLQEKGK